jgi:ribosomal-protein-alanine N-acetyltransferase
MANVLKNQLECYQRLETPRLLLRPIRLSDARDMFQYAKDVETTRYVFDRHHTLMETQAVIRRYFLAAPTGKFALELLETKQMIGTLDLHALDETGKSAEVGYCLNRAFWGQGLMTEALRSLTTLCFTQLDFELLIGRAHPNNHASRLVLVRCGFVFQSEQVSPPLLRYELDKTTWQVQLQ